MRNVGSRLALLLNIKSNAALDQVEDPREVLDYAYAQQQLHLRSVRRGLIEVAAARQRLEHEAERLRSRADRLEDQARRALRSQREDLARTALERKQAALAEIRGLEEQRAAIARDEERLRAADQQLAQRVERFKVHRSVATARYMAAEAQVSAFGDIGGCEAGEEAELSVAVERSEERINLMAARTEVLAGFGLVPPAADGWRTSWRAWRRRRPSNATCVRGRPGHTRGRAGFRRQSGRYY